MLLFGDPNYMVFNLIPDFQFFIFRVYINFLSMIYSYLYLTFSFKLVS